MRIALAGAAGEQEFLDRLRAAGVLVRQRHSTTNADEITGYAVALPGNRAADGAPIYFSGGRPAADLTLPRLRQRWGTAPASAAPPRPSVSRAERVEVLRRVAATTHAAAGDTITRHRDLLPPGVKRSTTRSNDSAQHRPVRPLVLIPILTRFAAALAPPPGLRAECRQGSRMRTIASVSTCGAEVKVTYRQPARDLRARRVDHSSSAVRRHFPGTR